jgi:sensor histidine kinase YesM
MNKGITLKGFFILMAGILLPMLSGLINYHLYSVIELLGSCLYFFFIAFFISTGCVWIINNTRTYFNINSNPADKIFSYSILAFLLSSLITGILLLGWSRISKEQFSWDQIMRSSCIGGLLAIIYSLGFEIILLGKERVLDTKIVDQLDRERATAELSALANEIDPHFMFNSLTALSHLISTDQERAHLFNQKLAQVYKYILMNKDREIISLQNEIDFIEDYFFILKLRHEDKLNLELRLNKSENHKNMVIPCALQVLVENAIKHNEFSKTDPLQIRIQMNGSYIKVMNNVKPKAHLGDSTKVGLRNLSNRYKLIANKDIIIEHYKNYFIVKLPLITQQTV